jgi:hypothetical protein
LQEIREAFDLFDTDGSGTIDAKVRNSCKNEYAAFAAASPAAAVVEEVGSELAVPLLLCWPVGRAEVRLLAAYGGCLLLA